MGLVMLIIFFCHIEGQKVGMSVRCVRMPCAGGAPLAMVVWEAIEEVCFDTFRLSDGDRSM